MLRGSHDAIRNTWGLHLKDADLRFFMGDGESFGPCQDDEIYLRCPDDYMSLPLKTKAILKWFLDTQHSHIFLCDTDTFVIPHKLMSCGYEGADYAGKISRLIGVPFPYTAIDRDGKKHFYPRCYPWASGGYGYFLSRHGAEIVLADKSETYFWAEDMMLGDIMNRNLASVVIKDLPYLQYQCTWHFPAAQFGEVYDPKLKWQESMYEEHILGLRPR